MRATWRLQLLRHRRDASDGAVSMSCHVMKYSDRSMSMSMGMSSSSGRAALMRHVL